MSKNNFNPIQVYPKTKASKVIVKTEIDTADEVTLEEALATLGTFATKETWAEGQKHIAIGGLSKDQSLDGKTSLYILSAILSPLYAPYWKNSKSSVTITGTNDEDLAKGPIIRFNSGTYSNSVSTYFKATVSPRTVYCYNKSYNTSEVSITYTAITGTGGTTSNTNGIVTKTFTNIGVNFGNSEDSVTLSNESMTKKIAPVARVLADAVSDSDAVNDEYKLVPEKTLPSKISHNVVFYPPAIFYYKEQSLTYLDTNNKPIFNKTNYNIVMSKTADTTEEQYIYYYVRDGVSYERYVKDLEQKYTVEAVDVEVSDSAMYGVLSDGAWELTSEQPQNEGTYPTYHKYRTSSRVINPIDTLIKIKTI